MSARKKRPAKNSVHWRQNRVVPLSLVDKIKAWGALERAQRELTLKQDFEAAQQVIADRRKLAFEICQNLHSRFTRHERTKTAR